MYLKNPANCYGGFIFAKFFKQDKVRNLALIVVVMLPEAWAIEA